jgi:molybdopterin-guanine dinucleotide biosynthesis protein A
LSGFSQDIINVQFASQGQSIQYNVPNFPNEFHRKTLFNEQDLVLVNANYLSTSHQIYIAEELNEKQDLPTFYYNQKAQIIAFIEDFMQANLPKLNGLVLMGGKSTRMGKDKGMLDYHGKPQREYVYDLLSGFCEEVYYSGRAEQFAKENTNKIEDRFVNLGPMGGILSAMMSQPELAWLVVACDLPFIDKNTLGFLIQNRNPAKIATAFLDSQEQFPEPLVAIWEPKSYLTLYQFLSQGYSCPRKVLINSEIHLIKVPDNKALTNANEPKDYENAKKELNKAFSNS